MLLTSHDLRGKKQIDVGLPCTAHIYLMRTRMFAQTFKETYTYARSDSDSMLFEMEDGGSLPASFIYTQTFKQEYNIQYNIIDMNNVMVRITDCRPVSKSPWHDNIYACTRETSTTKQKISVAHRKTLESFDESLFTLGTFHRSSHA